MAVWTNCRRRYQQALRACTRLPFGQTFLPRAARVWKYAEARRRELIPYRFQQHNKSSESVAANQKATNTAAVFVVKESDSILIPMS